ncbi:MAG: O-antigen ligase [Paludibacter sp.]|nr:O-antigen ligase [Paludibacter sp.]
MRDNSIFVFINFVLYLLAFFFILKKHKNSLLGKFIFLIYLISSICSILEYKNPNSMIDYKNITFFPFLYLFICYIFISFPIVSFGNKQYTSIISPNINRLNFLIISLLLIIFLDFILSFSSLSGVITSLTNTDNFSYIYNDTINDNADKMTLGTNYLHIIASAFSDVLPFLFFYYLTLERKSKLILFFLLISLLHPLINTISYAGRNGLVVFILLLSSNYILFKNLYTKLNKRIIIMIIIFFGAFTVLTIMAITYARFSTGMQDDNSAIESVISYGGQSALNFNEYIFNTKAYSYGDNSFPLIRMILGLDYSNNPIIRQENWGYKMQIPVHIFYTLIGDLTLDFGPIITILLIIILSTGIYRKTKKNIGGIKVYDIFLIYFWFNISAQAIFYFMNKTIGGNIKIAVFVLMYIFMKRILYSSNKGVL